MTDMPQQALAKRLRIVVSRQRLPQPEMRAHTRACNNCPSMHFPPDPEAEALLQEPHAVRVENAFPCGWNGKRFCKGYCVRNGVSDDDLQTLAPRYAAGA